MEFQNTKNIVPIKSNRRYELDLLKVITIFEMIFMHLQENVFSSKYGDYLFVEKSFSQLFLDNVFYLTGPFGFMFSMGCTMLFSRNQDAASDIKRGAKLVLLWLMLNLLRGFFHTLKISSESGVNFGDTYLFFIFVNDVLFFAGFAFLIIGFLKKIGVKFKYIFLLSALMFFVAYAIGGIEGFTPKFLLSAEKVAQPSAFSMPEPLCEILSGFVYIEHLSSFPVLNWFIVVCLGMSWGVLLKRCKNVDLLYLITGILGIVGSSIAIFILSKNGLLDFKTIQTTVSNPLGAHHVNPISLICSLCGLAVILSACHFIMKVFSSQIFRNFIAKLSSHILEIYFAHWLLVEPIALANFPQSSPKSILFIALSAFAIYAISFFTALVFKRLTAKKKEVKTN